ncbi:FAD dependent sulfhydryl oxidase Erv1 [Aspergillus sclerotiicarbonarius CBS 121057]|uniref:Sulfhydryl oxidase n=1 Tax=Aspergillus sclerotiicarbonarius (strain CBS 121057 / IBT 28362) TaxID=1448318 RepID=A0A319EJP3_ASPSB|nr:FAD dependent sulfhydryl oxidase Erv1 [Aspergillus sclerotiicarbonarius CBS 121057]
MSDSNNPPPDTQKHLFIHQQQQPTAPSSAQPSMTTAPAATKDDTVPAGMTKLPNGVILDKDGKPCRLCTSAASWRALTKQAKSTPTTTTSSNPSPATTTPGQGSYTDCPPDSEALGRSTWTFLHSLTASYPAQASTEQQSEMRTFLGIFSRLYPCWVCADDFRNWMAEPSGANEPRLKGRQEFGDWMCRAHNEVNRKLGKKEFDCKFWEERWRTGWKDGRCD